jgi:nitrite reductase/ring-hydroxylating ferredoxin subunit/uncharacterized membrane protein
MAVLTERVEQAVDDLTPDAVNKGSTNVSLAIHSAILAGGYPTRKIADFLHGTWLGHPLHPVLTDLTIGAWAMSSAFDWAGHLTDSDDLRRTGDQLAVAGTISAVPTAISGIVDYSTFPEPSAAPVTWHAVLNIVNFGLYLASVRERRRGNHTRGAVLGAIGLALTGVSAWLGGSLVYRYKVGVNHADKFEGPKQWTPVMDLKDLPPREAKKIDFEGKPVLVYRRYGEVYAIGDTCSHAGGPLHEGKFSGSCVTCPWHDSVFDMKGGHIVHGPATQKQPSFNARVRDGKVEIRFNPQG